MSGPGPTGAPPAAPDPPRAGPGEAAIRISGLVKRFGSHTALDGLDLDVRRGEVFGFLGPNGAGKTTTIRLLLDLIRPTAGSVTILGEDPRRGGPALRRRIGYLPDEVGIDPRVTGRRFLELLGRLRGGLDERRLGSLAERFGATLDRPVGSLSRGNRQKIGLLQALVFHAEVLVLDEPTAGFDPLVQAEFAAAVREVAAEGRTVFLSSHDLSEVQQVADRVGIIRRGRLIEVAAVADLRAGAARQVKISFRRRVPAAVRDLDGFADAAVEGTTLSGLFAGSMDALVKALAGHEVMDLVCEEADLDDVFLARYGDGRPGEARR